MRAQRPERLCGMRWIERCCAAAGVLALLAVGSARADWNPGDPAKWVQLPDLSPQGMDVYATARPGQVVAKILADDWACTSIDPITDIHIWGSWLNDELPIGQLGPGQIGPDPAAVVFKLSIHADVPATGNTPSHPGPVLWQTVTMASSVRPYGARLKDPELFFNPNNPPGQQIIGYDYQVWQYNFTNLRNELGLPFIQQGTPERPVIYWLDVQAMPLDGLATFGWKTAIPPHRLDDAVFGDTEGFNGPLIVGGGILNSGWTEMY